MVNVEILQFKLQIKTPFMKSLNEYNHLSFFSFDNCFFFRDNGMPVLKHHLLTR